MPYIAPRRPVVTANGIASSVMTMRDEWKRESSLERDQLCADVETARPQPRGVVAQLRVAHESLIRLLRGEVVRRLDRGL